MFNEICAKFNWSPVSNLSTNGDNIQLSDEKKLLFREIIECRRLGHFDISLKLAECGLTYYPDDPRLTR